MTRDWPRHARALDLRLSGMDYAEISKHIGCSPERARKIVKLAKAQLAFRVFRGLPRPRPPSVWLKKAHRV